MKLNRLATAKAARLNPPCSGPTSRSSSPSSTAPTAAITRLLPGPAAATSIMPTRGFLQPVLVDRHRLGPAEHRRFHQREKARQDHRADRIDMAQRIERQPVAFLCGRIAEQLGDIAVGDFVEDDGEDQRQDQRGGLEQGFVHPRHSSRIGRKMQVMRGSAACSKRKFQRGSSKELVARVSRRRVARLLLHFPDHQTVPFNDKFDFAFQASTPVCRGAAWGSPPGPLSIVLIARSYRQVPVWRDESQPPASASKISASPCGRVFIA